MSEGISKLIDLCAQFFQFFVPFVILDHYERGVVLRLGVFKREIGPGFHWCLPFSIDRVLHDNVVTRTKDLAPQRLVTKDGRTVAVTAFVTCHICDIRKSLLEVESVDEALIDACSAFVGEHVSASTWDELREGDNLVKLTRSVRNHARAYGIEIERVQLVDLAPCRVISIHGGKL